jgi:hypothetical protein
MYSGQDISCFAKGQIKFRNVEVLFESSNQKRNKIMKKNLLLLLATFFASIFSLPLSAQTREEGPW